MLRTAIGIGLVLRFLVAIWNGFFGPSFGADLDAVSYHLASADYARNLQFDGFRIGIIYAYVLGLIYYLTTDSLFLGSLLSCVAWLASAHFLRKILCLLSVGKSRQFMAMLIYALLPSSIFLTSVTLREPYQLLFINLAIYAALKIYVTKSAMHWPVLLFAVIGMGVLHGAVLAFGIYILVATLTLLAFRRSRGLSLAKLLCVTPIVALVVFAGTSMFSERTSYNLTDGLGAGISSYQEGVLNADARTNYKEHFKISDDAELLLFVPVTLFQYLFEPMPWRISTASDVGILLENCLRIWLIWKAVTTLRRVPIQGRRSVIFVLLSYFTIETVWSLGTVNWGTAVRHHIPGFGLLIAAAFAYSGRRQKNEVNSLRLRPIQ